MPRPQYNCWCYAVLTLCLVRVVQRPQSELSFTGHFWRTRNNLKAPRGDAALEDQEASQEANEDELRFFVVGDIGEPGQLRQGVATAMARLMQQQPGNWGFVLSLGDNFYPTSRWQSELDEEADFARLEREMLCHIPLPWYMAFGNHDLKKPRKLHRRMHGASGPAIGGRWTWRCPSIQGYSILEDWSTIQGMPEIPEGLLDMFVVNTNKFQMLLDSSFNWDQQKAWLKDKLASSKAAWKLVVGHHPIEFVPHSLLEHAVPGLRYLTTTFMTGKPLVKKLYSRSMADVILAGGADAYLCGHQHLMAHLVRKQVPRRLTLRRGAPNMNCSFIIVGSSSKTEQTDLDTPTPMHPRVLRKLENVKKKMHEFWCQEQIGFVVVRASLKKLRSEFFAVDSKGLARQVYRFEKTRNAE